MTVPCENLTACSLRKEPLWRRSIPPSAPRSRRHQQKSNAASNPHICRELCLPFPWQVFSRQPIKSVRQVVRAGVDCRLVTQTKKFKTTPKEDTMTQTIATQRSSEQTADKNAIRPFHVNIPEAVLADLRQRLAQTRLPTRKPSPIIRRAYRLRPSSRF